MTASASANLLLSDVEYEITETRFGVRRRFLYPNGRLFTDFVSHRSMFGLPLVHLTHGICPETGKRVVAKGVVAIGRLAIGVVAIGQVSVGLIAIGQLGLGILFGLAQASTGMFAIGQIAFGSYAAIGQLAFGKFVLAQLGIGEFVWDMRGQAPQAAQFFQSLLP